MRGNMNVKLAKSYKLECHAFTSSSVVKTSPCLYCIECVFVMFQNKRDKRHTSSKLTTNVIILFTLKYDME